MKFVSHSAFIAFRAATSLSECLQRRHIVGDYFHSILGWDRCLQEGGAPQFWLQAGAGGVVCHGGQAEDGLAGQLALQQDVA